MNGRAVRYAVFALILLYFLSKARWSIARDIQFR